MSKTVVVLIVWAIACSVILVSAADKIPRGKRKPSCISDETYDALLALLNGESLPPVKLRTRAQKAAVVRYWRDKDKLTIKREGNQDVLLLDGARILRSSEIGKLVSKEFSRSKGSGAQKIVHSLKEKYVGLSKKTVQSILNKDKNHFQRHARFNNKAVLRPIKAKGVSTRHQVDLMDMGKKGSIMLNGITYRYVLSLLDVFSRFVWLRPLKEKSSKAVMRQLKSIYNEHGPPEVLQCDQGVEFKGELKRYCRKMNIQMIRSSPYHPQSQGKVERSHRTLRSKIEYDFVRMGEKGLNWVKALTTYQRLLNDEPKEVIGYKSPLEVYYARKNNFPKVSIKNCEYKNNPKQSPKEISDRSKHAFNVRRVALKSSLGANKRMIRKHLSSNPPSEYNVGETVFVRLSRKTKPLQKRRFVVEATIIKRNLKHHSYKVSYTSPLNKKTVARWVQVNDVTHVV